MTKGAAAIKVADFRMKSSSTFAIFFAFLAIFLGSTFAVRAECSSPTMTAVQSDLTERMAGLKLRMRLKAVEGETSSSLILVDEKGNAFSWMFDGDQCLVKLGPGVPLSVVVEVIFGASFKELFPVGLSL